MGWFSTCFEFDNLIIICFFLVAGPQQTNTAAPAGPPAVPPGMNDAQLQKAYAALGLPYNGNKTSSLPGNNPNRTQVNTQGMIFL